MGVGDESYLDLAAHCLEALVGQSYLDSAAHCWREGPGGGASGWVNLTWTLLDIAWSEGPGGGGSGG